MKRCLPLLLLIIPAVIGHAVPYESEPGAGMRLSMAPDEITVRFTEPVYEDGTWIRLFDVDGQRVDNDDLGIQFGNRPTLTVSVGDIPDGPYRIQWQTYSQTDGHTIGGSIGFAIGSFAPPATETADAAANPLAVAARMLQYVSYALGAGALLATYLRWAGPTRNALLVSGAGNVLAHTMLLLENANATGLGAAYLQSEGGLDLLLRTIAWTAFIVLAIRPRFKLIVTGWLVLSLLDARFGHASQSGAWAIGAELLHLLSISLWVGGLAWFVRYGTKEQGREFGRIAMWSTIVMAFTGFALTIGILGPEIWNLTSSFWGKLLTVKLILVAAMLLLAAINRFIILAGPDDPGKRLRAKFNTERWTLRRVAGTEAAIGVATLLVAGILLSVGAPGATLVASFSDDLPGFDISGTLQITPEPKSGEEHEIRLFMVKTDTNEPIQNNTCGRESGCIRLSWYADAEGELTAQEIALRPEGDGWWTGSMIFFDKGPHTWTGAASTAWLSDTLTGSVVVS
jgi:copper transport protein